MGTFSIEIKIGDMDREQCITMDALVDAGAFLTSVPASVLRVLNVEPVGTRRVRFAQGEPRNMEIGYAWIRLEGKEAITQVLFNDGGTQPVLGRFILDGLFLEIDPETQN